MKKEVRQIATRIDYVLVLCGVSPLAIAQKIVRRQAGPGPAGHADCPRMPGASRPGPHMLDKNINFWRTLMKITTSFVWDLKKLQRNNFGYCMVMSKFQYKF